jgi:hypothetical protein
VFGGMFNCSIEMNTEIIHFDRCEHNNTFWDLVSIANITSQSTFVNYEESGRVKFCKNNYVIISIWCYKIMQYFLLRGEKFTVPLMVADDCCFPFVEPIEAKIREGGKGTSKSPLQFKPDCTHIQRAKKHCHSYSYVLTGGLGLTTATIEFSIAQQFFSGISPATLNIRINNCPLGFKTYSQSGECDCQDVLKLHKIECFPGNLSLLIPALTWVGELEEGSGLIAVQDNCQYCKKEESLIIADWKKLCNSHRAGVLCGVCVSNYTLLLGGYECADCSNTMYKGVLFVIAFIFAGITLVLLLLGLNLTVSTGMINGLIFYSNIVYLNGDTLLPITSLGKSTHLQNAIRIPSTFQAWINLDLGISTCFFRGYDTYISTWLQFAFPLYIWLLVLVLIMASRYSNRISNLVNSNIVSVLATLLLLSYAKLVRTSIDAFSFVQLQLLDGNMTNYLWKPDANIPYLGRHHLP